MHGKIHAGPTAAVLSAILLTAVPAQAQVPDVPFTINVLSEDSDEIVETIEVLFNPKEYTIEKSAPWSEQASGVDAAAIPATSGDGLSLSMDLDFDGSDKGEDVRPVIRRIRDLVPVEEDRKKPPVLLVQWGQGLQFRGVLESVRETYTLFKSDGTPIRAKVSAHFTEFTPPEEQRKETPRH